MIIEWNKVTWYSKIAAVIIFVGTFFTGFWLGTMNAEKVYIEIPYLIKHEAPQTNLLSADIPQGVYVGDKIGVFTITSIQATSSAALNGGGYAELVLSGNYEATSTLVPNIDENDNLWNFFFEPEPSLPGISDIEILNTQPKLVKGNNSDQYFTKRHIYDLGVKEVRSFLHLTDKELYPKNEVEGSISVKVKFSKLVLHIYKNDYWITPTIVSMSRL